MSSVTGDWGSRREQDCRRTGSEERVNWRNWIGGKGESRDKESKRAGKRRKGVQ